MVIEIIGATFCPLLSGIELVLDFGTIVGSPPAPPAGIVFVTVGNKFLHRLSLDEVNGLACSLAVHEVTHVNAALVDEQIQNILIFQHVLDKPRGRLCECPGSVRNVRIINQVDGVVGITCFIPSVESESEVGILNYETPDFGQARLCVVVIGTPENEVVAREVDITIEEVHNHDIQIFADIHPLLVFGLGMALLAIESLEGIIECGVFAPFEFLDKQILTIFLFVRDFHHVDVLKTIVVAVDIILVRTLTDV